MDRHLDKNPNNGPKTSPREKAFNYNEAIEFQLGGNRLSLCSDKNGYSVDVYLNGKICGSFLLSSGNREFGRLPRTHSFESVKENTPIIIGKDIYIKNGYDFIKVKEGGMLEILENITMIKEYDGQAVFVEWDNNKKLHFIKLNGKQIGEGYNMIEDIYGNDLSLSGSKFDFNMSHHGRPPMFGFIGKKGEYSGRVFVKIDPKTNEVKISDEFGKIEFKHGGNRPTMLGRNITHREDIK